MSKNYTDLGICLRVICQKGSPLEVLGWLNYEFYGKKGQILYAVGIRGKNQVLFHKFLKTKYATCTRQIEVSPPIGLTFIAPVDFKWRPIR